jgi:hypothetical protein
MGAAVELSLFVFIAWRRGQLYMVTTPSQKGGKTISSIYHVFCFLLMCFAPWTTLRIDTLLGGRVFCGFIVYKLVSYSAMFLVLSGKFGEDELAEAGLEISAEGGWLMFIVPLVVTVFSAVAFMWACRDSHRWTFYESRHTGPEYFSRAFVDESLEEGQDREELGIKSNASLLVADCHSLDHLRCWYAVEFHPSFLDKDGVKRWLLNLRSDNVLFAREDRKLPYGCADVTGFSLEGFFDKVLENYSWHGDDEGVERIKKHLTAVKLLVFQMVFLKGGTINRVGVGSPAKVLPEEDMLGEGNDSLISVGRENAKTIAQKDAAIAASAKTVTEKEGVIAEQAKEIAELREMIAVLKKTQ